MSDYTPDDEDAEVYFALGAAEYRVGEPEIPIGDLHDGWRRWLAAHDADTREQCAREIEKWRDDNLHHVPQPADDLAGYYMRSGTIDGATIAAQVIREGGPK